VTHRSNSRKLRKCEQSTSGSFCNSTPPERYSTNITLPLPTDKEIGPDMVHELQQSHDLNVARMLAGTADMYSGAKALVQAVFQAKDIDPRLRELIILRSAYLLNCPYEWQANVLMAKNTGCTQAEIDAVTADGPVTGIGPEIDLVMLATDELTTTGTLTDDTLQRLRSHYDDVICRKLVLIIAWFNLLARFLNGCRVPLESGDKLGTRTSPLG
jgi:alkylhydroperoxidase family enzyme